MNDLLHHFVGELLGTMILILFGDGVVAGVLLRRSKAENAGWVAVTAGWAFGVLSGVVTAKAFGAPGAINPAISLAGVVTGAVPPTEGALQIAGQFAGAFLGAVLVWLHYGPHWAETPEPGLKLAVFCTAPAIRLPAANLLSEVIATFALVFVGSGLGRTGSDSGFAPSLAAALVWGVGLSLGGPTGYAINPARDLSPRLAHAVLPIPGKGDSDWGYAWIPVAGPFIGGIIAMALYKVLGGAV